MQNNTYIKNKVSYLIPVYNHDKYVELLLNSIFEDAKKLDGDKDIIIIDDGSTDNSNLAIQNWIDNQDGFIKIKYITRENKGLTVTLNELISCSDSEYLRLCASDDILIPNSTNIMLQTFKKNNNLLAVCGDGIIIDENSNKTYNSSIKYHGGNIDKLINEESSYNELILHWCIAGPCSLIKKEFYDEMKYLENESIDDFYLYLTLIEKNALKIISDKLCYYRLHDNNTSKTTNIEKRVKNLKSFLNIIVKFKKLELKYRTLSSLRSLTEAKIAYFEKSYLLSIYNLVKYFLYRIMN
jgi:glycosyltransferase involved in cell wall biosynthesis